MMAFSRELFSPIPFHAAMPVVPNPYHVAQLAQLVKVVVCRCEIPCDSSDL